MEWSHPHSYKFYVVLALALAGLLGLALRFASAPSARSALLVALRAAALSVLVVILLNPVRLAELRRPGRKPGAAFLLDGSRSMGLEKPVNRIDAANRLIAQADLRIPLDRRP